MIVKHLCASARVVLAGVNTFLKDFTKLSVMNHDTLLAIYLCKSLTCNSWDTFVAKGMTRKITLQSFFTTEVKETAFYS